MWGNVTLGGLTNFSDIFLWFTQETKVSSPIRLGQIFPPINRVKFDFRLILIKPGFY